MQAARKTEVLTHRVAKHVIAVTRVVKRGGEGGKGIGVDLREGFGDTIFCGEWRKELCGEGGEEEREPVDKERSKEKCCLNAFVTEGSV